MKKTKLEKDTEEIEESLEDAEEAKQEALEDEAVADDILEEVDWQETARVLQEQLEAARNKILELSLELEELKAEQLSEEERIEQEEIEALLEELGIEDEEDKEVYAALGKERLMKLTAARKPKALSNHKPVIDFEKQTHSLSKDEQDKIKSYVHRRISRLQKRGR